MLIYELIDGEQTTHGLSSTLLHLPSPVEIIDFGYPQNSEADTLKTYITTESIVSTSIAAVRVAVHQPFVPEYTELRHYLDF